MQERYDWLQEVISNNKKRGVGIPEYAPFGDNKWFYTTKELVWIAEGEHEGIYRDVVVPEKFVTDLTSVPKAFWSVLPRDGKYLPAAIVHDFMYWVQDASKETADDIMNIGMIELNVSRLKRSTIYQAVSKLGGGSWKGNAKLKANGEKRIMAQTPTDVTTTWEEWKLKPGVFD